MWGWSGAEERAAILSFSRTVSCVLVGQQRLLPAYAPSRLSLSLSLSLPLVTSHHLPTHHVVVVVVVQMTHPKEIARSVTYIPPPLPHTSAKNYKRSVNFFFFLVGEWRLMLNDGRRLDDG